MYARLLVFDKTSAQPHFAAVNCSDAVTSVLYSYIFALMNCCVVAVIAFSCDILAGSADSIYQAMAWARGGFGVKHSTLSFDILQHFITCLKGINCARILFVVNLST